MGFLNNRITFNTAYYRHRSSNQLISYRLPNQTGFSSVVKNLPAVVENTGWEIVLNTILIATKKWDWKISVNSTIPSNKLLSFPGLQSSSYSGYYTVGKSLSAIQKIKFTGIDPATGLYSYEDYNKDGTISTPGDLQLLGNLDPAYYGGIASSLHYGSWVLDIFFDYTKQKGPNYLAFQYLYPAGFLINQPSLVIDRWQKIGDQTLVQRFGATAASPVYAASSKLLASDGIFSDASFIRFKNLSLSYNIPVAVLAKKKIETLRLYMQAQNICTFTKYKGADPETKNFTQLPPLKTLVFGIQLTF
ncbi:MAG: hypothetical protein IPK31_07135 [Chitinophagaceae bacterium]|nr:hypothetical protein [Chitinophagaceae bacterium]